MRLCSYVFNGSNFLLILLVFNYVYLQGALIPEETLDDDEDPEEANLFEGDIIGMDTHGSMTDMQHNVIKSESSRWPDGLVPYEMKYIRQGNDLANRIHKAMENISETTCNCIRFIPRTEETSFVKIVPVERSACAAQIGRKSKSYSKIFLSRECEVHDIIHELLHILGFYHEHTRMDRDRYITVHEDNIQENFRKNYEKRPDGDGLGQPYDYRSIMHYPPDAPEFAINRLKPIMTVIGSAKLVANEALSELDITKISIAYKCATGPLCSISVGHCHVFRKGLETTEKPFFLKTYVQVTECEGEDMSRVSLYCGVRATTQDAESLAGRLRCKPKVSLYSLYVPDGAITKPGLFQNLKEKVKQLGIHNCVSGTAISKLRASSLTELIDFGLFNCSDQEIKKVDFENNAKLKRLVFHATTIASIERDAFTALTELKMLQLEEWWKPNEIKPSEMRKVNAHLQKLHCSCDYKWFRDWLTSKPNLFQERSLSEFYTASRDVITIGEMYIAINCRSVSNSLYNWKSLVTTRYANKRLGRVEPFSKMEPAC